MIEISSSNAIRNDLIHSNEYIRGRTLRLLCRMRYYKILEPLIESVLKNLSHRHAYVRRNAVTCVYSIVKTFGPEVIPQASVEIEQLLLVEGDLSTKRIAFIMLLNCDIDRAINYAISVEEQVTSLGDVFQLALLDLVRKVAKTRPGHRAKLMKLVFYLANASSPAVMFECAQILSKFASSPSAAQIAASSYVNLVNSQPDNNVKLIVLENLERMAASDSERHVVETQVMDILRGLSCPALGVRRKIISLASGLLSNRNVADVVALLRKEIAKANSPENMGAEGVSEYRRLLIQTLQDASRKFPEFSEGVVATLLDLLRETQSEKNQETSFEVIVFLREVMSASNPGMRRILVQRLSQLLPALSRSRVVRMALWLIGEFAEEGQSHVRVILDCLGPLPIIAAPNRSDTDVDKEVSESEIIKDTSAEPVRTVTTKTVVLADGTYASQAVYGTKSVNRTANMSGLRTLIVNGDILLATVTGVVVAKLFVRSNLTPSNELLFALTCLVRIVKGSLVFGGKDQVARLVRCLRVVAEPTNKSLRAACEKEWGSEACRLALTRLVTAETALRLKRGGARSSNPKEPVGKPIVFRVLKEKRDLLADPNLLAMDMQHSQPDGSESIAPGVVAALSLGRAVDPHLFSQRLAKAVPMTGLADAVYIEGFLRLHSFDLILELSIVNRTAETLQNVLVELCAHGDLRVVDKPVAVTLSPGEAQTVFATIKVSSTENGIIFGYATYDRKSEKEWLVLNEIRADVLDYMQPGCSVAESEFKTMWQDFEWENKIVVNTTMECMMAFVQLLTKHTNLALIGTEAQVGLAKTLLASSPFAAVNLYAKSIFDEDALANVSLEKSQGGLVGTVRIRARTQGIALSLGDKVSSIQREQKLRGA